MAIVTIRFRNKLGQFTKRTRRARVFVDSKEVKGKAREAFIPRITKRRKKVIQEIQPDIVSEKFSNAVPQDLSNTFSWFVENPSKLDGRSVRMIYAIVEIGASAISGDRTLDLDAGTIVPLQMGIMTIAKSRKITVSEIREQARLKNLKPMTDVIAIVAKRPKDEIQDNARNNPLAKEKKRVTQAKTKKRKKAETKRRNTKRRRFQQ